MFAIVIVASTLFLGVTMSRSEALKPQPPPSLDLYTDGSTVGFVGNAFDGGDQMTAAILGVYAAQVGENYLRDTVQLFSCYGGYLILFLLTCWKLLLSFRFPLCKDPLQSEIRLLSLAVVMGQLLVIVSGAWNNLPVLIDGCHQPNPEPFFQAIRILVP